MINCSVTDFTIPAFIPIAIELSLLVEPDWAFFPIAIAELSEPGGVDIALLPKAILKSFAIVLCPIAIASSSSASHAKKKQGKC